MFVCKIVYLKVFSSISFKKFSLPNYNTNEFDGEILGKLFHCVSRKFPIHKIRFVKISHFPMKTKWNKIIKKKLFGV